MTLVIGHRRQKTDWRNLAAKQKRLSRHDPVNRFIVLADHNHSAVRFLETDFLYY